MDTSLVMNFFGKDRTLSKSLTKVERGFATVGREAKDAMDKAGRETSQLDRKIERLEDSVAELNREINETANTDLLPKVAKERRLLIKLKKVQSELRETANEADDTRRHIATMFATKTVATAGNRFFSGFSQVLKGAGGPLAATVVAFAVYIASLIAIKVGAALVSSLFLVLGGGVLAAGIVMAVKDPKVKKAWQGFGETAMKSLAGFSKPFKGPMIRAAKTFGDMMKRLEPAFTRIGKALAPVIDKLAPGIAGLVESMMPGLEKFLVASVPFFEILAQRAPELGAAFGEFFTILANRGPQLQHLFRELLGFVIWVLPKIAGFLSFLVQVSYGMSYAIALVSHWFKKISAGGSASMAIVRSVVNTAKERIKTAFGVVKSVISTAISKFVTFRNAVRDKVNSAVATIRSIPGRVRKALRGLGAAISAPFRNGFNAIRNAWNNIVGGKGFSIPSWVPGLGGKSFRMPYFHTGGIVPGRGDTPIMAKGGEGVFTRDQMKALGGGGQQVVVEFRFKGADEEFLKFMRKSIRVRGGNVQTVVGS